MPEDFQLRVATAADAEAIDALAEASADGGAIAFRIVRHVRTEGDGLTRSLGVVAEDPAGRIIGAASLRLGEFRYEGETRPFALLASLMVHPDHRRKGVAAALARWRIERAEAEAGDRVVVLADIQKGNAASLAAARRWAHAFTSPALAIPVPMRSRAPRRSAYELREARIEELADVAARVTAATDGHEFARVWTAERLAAWLAWSPLPQPVHHYRVAAAGGAVVAGLALREDGLISTMELVRMPPAIRLANAFLRVVPRDGRLRNLAVEHLWFAEGHAAAAAALWQDTRWTWRTRGSDLVIAIDPRDPVRAILGLRPWHPSTSFVSAVRARPLPEPGRLIAPLE